MSSSSNPKSGGSGSSGSAPPAPLPQKAPLAKFRPANPRVGDRICTEIKGRPWIAGAKFETPALYQSPPTDVVADRLAKQGPWSNPRSNLGTVVGASANRRELTVRLDERRDQKPHNVTLDARLVVDGSGGRTLSNQQVGLLIETVVREEKALERLHASRLREAAAAADAATAAAAAAAAAAATDAEAEAAAAAAANASATAAAAAAAAAAVVASLVVADPAAVGNTLPLASVKAQGEAIASRLARRQAAIQSQSHGYNHGLNSSGSGARGGVAAPANGEVLVVRGDDGTETTIVVPFHVSQITVLPTGPATGSANNETASAGAAGSAPVAVAGASGAAPASVGLVAAPYAAPYMPPSSNGLQSESQAAQYAALMSGAGSAAHAHGHGHSAGAAAAAAALAAVAPRPSSRAGRVRPQTPVLSFAAAPTAPAAPAPAAAAVYSNHAEASAGARHSGYKPQPQPQAQYQGAQSQSAASRRAATAWLAAGAADAAGSEQYDEYAPSNASTRSFINNSSSASQSTGGGFASAGRPCTPSGQPITWVPAPAPAPASAHSSAHTGAAAPSVPSNSNSASANASVKRSQTGRPSARGAGHSRPQSAFALGPSHAQSQSQSQQQGGGWGGGQNSFTASGPVSGPAVSGGFSAVPGRAVTPVTPGLALKHNSTARPSSARYGAGSNAAFGAAFSATQPSSSFLRQDSAAVVATGAGGGYSGFSGTSSGLGPQTTPRTVGGAVGTVGAGTGSANPKRASGVGVGRAQNRTERLDFQNFISPAATASGGAYY